MNAKIKSKHKEPKGLADMKLYNMTEIVLSIADQWSTATPYHG